MAKSEEQKTADAIARAMNKRGMSNRLIAYFLHHSLTNEVLNEILDVFFHLIRYISDSPVPDYLTMDQARTRMLADSIVRAVEDSGMEFRD